MQWWQHIPEYIDPIALTVGFFSVRWYAICLLLGFGAALWYALRRIREEKIFSVSWVWEAAPWLFFGGIVGARIGYALLYAPAYFAEHPERLIVPYDVEGKMWTGIAGMSYFGGLIGVMVVLFVLTRKKKQDFFVISDLLAGAVPLVSLFGRLGNFMNGELYGRITNVSWGMFFPSAGDFVLRHPSQLYEAFLEGMVLFGVLSWYRSRAPFPGAVTALYFVGYALARFGIEFFREPDATDGGIWSLSTGQVLSGILFICGVALYRWCSGRKYGIVRETR